MSEILNLIKDLRDRTGAGFVDCKKALIESNNQIENAIETLRKNPCVWTLKFCKIVSRV